MFEIRDAHYSDVPKVTGLIREFAVFEKLEESCRIDEETLAAALFGEDAGVGCIVAQEGGSLVGYSLFYRVFRSFSGQSAVYIEDLYVVPYARGTGIGRALLAAVARHASSHGIKRLDWQVLRWNVDAMRFYESSGAESTDCNLDFTLTGKDFDNLLE
jgi:GNAT superfamily N-acetyltransferase